MRLCALIVLICLCPLSQAMANEPACAPRERRDRYREIAYRMIRADEATMRGDVLTRLDEIPTSDRNAFRDLVTEMRDTEIPIRGRGVHEHVMASVLANGRTADAAYDAQIPLTATDGVIEYMYSELRRMNPLSDDTIWYGPEFDQARENFRDAREALLARIEAARRQGWISYEDYLRTGVEFSIVSTLSVRRDATDPATIARFRRVGLPNAWPSLSSASRTMMDQIHGHLPHEVVVWGASPLGFAHRGRGSPSGAFTRDNGTYRPVGAG